MLPPTDFTLPAPSGPSRVGPRGSGRVGPWLCSGGPPHAGAGAKRLSGSPRPLPETAPPSPDCYQGNGRSYLGPSQSSWSLLSVTGGVASPLAERSPGSLGAAPALKSGEKLSTDGTKEVGVPPPSPAMARAQPFLATPRNL